MDKSYYSLPKWLNHADSRIIFVDLGASLYESGPGGENGASLRWFWDTYSQLSGRNRPFDRILAWEAREYRPKELWATFPSDIIPSISYFNVPADAAPDAKMNPWRILEAVVRPEDFVVVKSAHCMLTCHASNHKCDRLRNKAQTNVFRAVT